MLLGGKLFGVGSAKVASQDYGTVILSREDRRRILSDPSPAKDAALRDF
jgi:hypothetical protein